MIDTDALWRTHAAVTPRVNRCGCGRVTDDVCLRCDVRLAEAVLEAVLLEHDPDDTRPEAELAQIPAVIEASRAVREAEERMRRAP